MAKTDPYPLRFDRFLSEVSNMSYEETGQYIRLMGYYHQKGPVPDSVMSKAIDTVSSMFRRESDGWHHTGIRRVLKSMKEPPMSNQEKDMYNDILGLIRSQLGHKMMRGTSSSKRSFSARIRDGFTLNDFKYAILGLQKDEYHSESLYKYVNMDFLTRQDQLVKWSSAGRKEAKKGISPQSRVIND